MAEPQTVRVKISSEEAGAISITEVVSRDIPLRELVEYALPVSGKSLDRLREILRRGSLVSGASRFRWTGWESAEADLLGILATFPDPDPGRAFARDRCVHAVLRGPRRNVEIPCDAARARRGPGLWDALMEIAGTAGPVYAGYSYRRRADRYTLTLSPPAAAQVRAAAETVIYSTLRDQLRAAEILSVELYVER